MSESTTFTKRMRRSPRVFDLPGLMSNAPIVERLKILGLQVSNTDPNVSVYLYKYQYLIANGYTPDMAKIITQAIII